MAQNKNLPQLKLKRNDLENLPPIELPVGFTLRHFVDGDERAWERLVLGIGVCNFNESIRNHRFFKPERVKFICFNDEPVATATAWLDENNETVGYVHMVGANSEYKGKGLGYQVTNAVLHHMKTEGKISAALATDDFRLPAIKIYLKLGFLPELTHESHYERWQTVYEKLGMR